MNVRVAASLLAACIALSVASSARADEIEVPVQAGGGPAAYFITGPVQDDQLVHFGLKLQVIAILDQQLIQDNLHRVPSQYRSLLEDVEEIRISPSIFIPDSLIISPKIENTGIYGVTWRPIGIDFPLSRVPVRVAVSAGAILTYAYMHSDTLAASSMHFFRPGVDAQVDIEIPVTESSVVSLGWDSQFHIPQVIGGEFLEVTPLDESMWHFGQAYLMFQTRFPYTLNL